MWDWNGCGIQLNRKFKGNDWCKFKGKQRWRYCCTGTGATHLLSSCYYWTIPAARIIRCTRCNNQRSETNKTMMIPMGQKSATLPVYIFLLCYPTAAATGQCVAVFVALLEAQKPMMTTYQANECNNGGDAGRENYNERINDGRRVRSWAGFETHAYLRLTRRYDLFW